MPNGLEWMPRRKRYVTEVRLEFSGTISLHNAFPELYEFPVAFFFILQSRISTVQADVASRAATYAVHKKRYCLIAVAIQTHSWLNRMM